MEKFASYLNTNWAPSDEETKELKGFLESPLAQIQTLTSEIERLETLRQTLTTSTAQYQALLSPIRRLPQDVMELIFQHCLPTEHNPVMSTHEAPLLLFRVCSAWRTTALRCPRLWANIHIPIPVVSMIPDQTQHPREEVVHRLQRQRDAVLEWLRRSGGVPLSISIFQDLGSPDGREEERHDFLLMYEALLSVRKRWCRIEMCLPAWVWSSLFSREAGMGVRSGDTLPLLESISVDVNAGFQIWHEGIALEPIQPELWYQTTLLTSRSLRQVVLRDVYYALPVSPNWAQLTKLWIQGFNYSLSIDEALIVLSCTPLLVDCKLDLKWEQNDSIFLPSYALAKPTPLPSVISLPALKIFSITETTDIRHFFKRLHMPALQDLECSHEMMCTHEPCADILLTDSVKRLALNQIRFDASYIKNCLERTPRLTSLYLSAIPQEQGTFSLTGFYLDDAFLEHLSSFLDTCLELETIEFISAIFSDAALLRFIHALHRVSMADVNTSTTTPQRRPLHSVRVKFNRMKLPKSERVEVVKDLVTLEEEGVKVTLKYPCVYTKWPFSPWEGVPSVDRHSFDDTPYYI